jgi:nucleotide-binding universal stress UspA family protein
VFKTIMLALDGSEHAERAIPFAEELAKASGGQVVAVHVRELTASRGGAQPLHVDQEEIEAGVRGQVDGLTQRGVDANLRLGSIALGGAAHVIADLAVECHADLIVIGTRGRSAVRGVLLGGVTQRLLHLAHCPVLAVPPASRD